MKEGSQALLYTLALLYVATVHTEPQSTAKLQENAPWPKRGRNQYNFAASFAGGNDCMDKQWTYITQHMCTASVVAADGSIYCSDGKLLYAVNNQGSLRWSYPISDNQGAGSTPIIGIDGTIFVANPDDYGQLYAINSDGSLNWALSINNSLCSPAIGVDGTIYIGSIGYEDLLLAISSDGALKWNYSLNVSCSSYPPAIGADGTIYVKNSDTLLALSYEGSLMWTFAAYEYIAFLPVVGIGGTIYVVAKNTLYAVNPNSSLMWKYVVEGDPDDDDDGQIDTPLGIDIDGTIYFGSYRYIYAVYADGKKKFSHSTTCAYPLSTIAIGADAMYLCGGDNGVAQCCSYNKSNGFYIHSYNFDYHIEVDGRSLTDPAIGVDGTIYVGYRGWYDTAYNYYVDAIATNRGNPCSPYNYTVLAPCNLTSTSMTCGCNCVCIPGTYSTVTINCDNQICAPCAPNTYSVSYGASECWMCPDGAYSEEGWSVCSCPIGKIPMYGPEGFKSCEYCASPSWTRAAGSLQCNAVYIRPPIWLILTVYLTLLSTVISGLLQVKSECRLIVATYMVVPFSDIVTDIAYLLFQVYYSPLLFYFTTITVIMPLIFFSMELYKNERRCRFFKDRDFIFKRYRIKASTYLEYEFKSPHFGDIDALWKVIYIGIVGLIFIWIHVLFEMVPFFVLNVIMESILFTVGVAFASVWVFIGAMLHATHVFGITKVHDLWLSVWSGEKVCTDTKKEIISSEVAKSRVLELISENIPQLILQLVNNILLGQNFNWIAIASLTVTIYQTLDGLYKMYYYLQYRGKSLSEYPLEGGIPFLYQVDLRDMKQSSPLTEYLISDINDAEPPHIEEKRKKSTTCSRNDVSYHNRESLGLVH